MQKPLRFDVLSEGVIYRSESGLQGYYPRVVMLSEDEFVSSFVASEGMETPDIHPMISRSTDGGKTWHIQGPVDYKRDTASGIPYSETGFISQGPDETLFCLGSHWSVDPEFPDKPLIHPETCGMRTNLMALRRSSDGGRTWSHLESVPTGVDSPLEIPTGVVTLSNGDLLASFSTWKNWDGISNYGHRVMVIRSSDNGRSWSDAVTIFYDPQDKIGYWECRIAEMPNGRLVATCWAHDWAGDQDINNGFAVSDDKGVSWKVVGSMPVVGQTGWPMPLDDEHLLFAYNHRRSPVGVRGLIGRIMDTGCEMVYNNAIFEPQVRTESTISSDNYAVTDFQFGAPSVINLGGNKYMIVYWCVVQGRSGINYTIIEIKGEGK